MRLSFVATATLGLLLAIAPGVRAQDEKPEKPTPEKKKDDKKPSTDKPGEKGDEGDDEDDSKPKKPQEKMPLNPFAKAKKGDWSICGGKMKANFNGNAMTDTMKLIVKVKETADGEVTLTMKQSGGKMGGARPEQEVKFSTKENPTVNKYMSMSEQEKGGDDISDWKVEDDKKTVGEKEFVCKKITAKIKDKMGTDAKLTMWVTDETKGWGMVAMTIKGTLMGGGTLQMDVELKGYGNGDKADFGKTPAEEKVDEQPADDGDDAPKAKKDKKDKGDDDDAPPAPKKKKDKKDDE